MWLYKQNNKTKNRGSHETVTRTYTCAHIEIGVPILILAALQRVRHEYLVEIVALRTTNLNGRDKPTPFPLSQSPTAEAFCDEIAMFDFDEELVA